MPKGIRKLEETKENMITAYNVDPRLDSGTGKGH